MICADCGVGPLVWAEAGYVPWHRICSVCGSHWDLHPIAWGPARPRDRSPRNVATGGYVCGHDLPPDAEWCEECFDEPARVLRPVPAPEMVRWQDGRGEIEIDLAARVSVDAESPTWGEIIALLTPAHWASAEAPERVRQMAGSIVVSCAWAQRARFYR